MTGVATNLATGAEWWTTWLIGNKKCLAVQLTVLGTSKTYDDE